jgi:hypothetical protein
MSKHYANFTPRVESIADVLDPITLRVIESITRSVQTMNALVELAASPESLQRWVVVRAGMRLVFVLPSGEYEGGWDGVDSGGLCPTILEASATADEEYANMLADFRRSRGSVATLAEVANVWARECGHRLKRLGANIANLGA